MAEGFEAGDKLVNIIDERNRERVCSGLQAPGIEVRAAESTGQLDIKPWERAHIVGGRFDQQAMLASLDEAAQRAGSSYRLTRLWSNQEWALESVPGVEDLVEYECRFNYIWPKYSDAVVCVYDCTRFRADLLVQILRTHPYSIVGGILRENPFYVADRSAGERAARAVKPISCVP